MTRYWTRVSKAVSDLLSAIPAASGDKTTVQTWLTGVTTKMSTLSTKIDDLKARKKDLRGPSGAGNPMRGLRLVHKASGIRQSPYEMDLALYALVTSSKLTIPALPGTVNAAASTCATTATKIDFAGQLEIGPLGAVTAAAFRNYITAMTDARIAASDLLGFLRAGPPTPAQLSTALNNLNSTMGVPVPVTKKINRLIADIQCHEQNKQFGGGEGETSSYWPSSFIASSSSSSSTPP